MRAEEKGTASSTAQSTGAAIAAPIASSVEFRPGALAAMAGADFLCYVSPSEHLAIPDAADVREGVMASRIAAHAADIVKGIPGAAERDRKMAEARKALDWEAQARLALDPEKVRSVRQQRGTAGTACSMCGKYCAMDLVGEYLGAKATRC